MKLKNSEGVQANKDSIYTSLMLNSFSDSYSQIKRWVPMLFLLDGFCLPGILGCVQAGMDPVPRAMHFIHRYLLDMCHSVHVTDGESGVHEVRLLFLKAVPLD